MNRSLILMLIKKDWDLSKGPVMGFLAMGIISFGIIIFGKTQLAFTIGGVLLISTIIILAAFLVSAIVANERKEMTLSLVMSLPVTIMQYTYAKLSLCLAAYLAPWILLVAAALSLVVNTPIPDGLLALLIPLFLGLMCFFMLMLTVAIVTENQQATIVVMTCCNIGVSFFIFWLANMRSIGDQIESPEFTWVAAITWLVVGEGLFFAACLGAAIYLQSRKTDFI